MYSPLPKLLLRRECGSGALQQLQGVLGVHSLVNCLGRKSLLQYSFRILPNSGTDPLRARADRALAGLHGAELLELPVGAAVAWAGRRWEELRQRLSSATTCGISSRPPSSLSLPNTAAGCWGWHAEAVGARAPRHACWIEVEHHHTIDLEEPLPSATVVWALEETGAAHFPSVSVLEGWIEYPDSLSHPWLAILQAA